MVHLTLYHHKGGSPPSANQLTQAIATRSDDVPSIGVSGNFLGLDAVQRALFFTSIPTSVTSLCFDGFLYQLSDHHLVAFLAAIPANVTSLKFYTLEVPREMNRLPFVLSRIPTSVTTLSIPFLRSHLFDSFDEIVRSFAAIAPSVTRLNLGCNAFGARWGLAFAELSPSVAMITIDEYTHIDGYSEKELSDIASALPWTVVEVEVLDVNKEPSTLPETIVFKKQVGKWVRGVYRQLVELGIHEDVAGLILEYNDKFNAQQIAKLVSQDKPYIVPAKANTNSFFEANPVSKGKSEIVPVSANNKRSKNNSFFQTTRSPDDCFSWEVTHLSRVDCELRELGIELCSL